MYVYMYLYIFRSLRLYPRWLCLVASRQGLIRARYFWSEDDQTISPLGPTPKQAECSNAEQARPVSIKGAQF